MELSRYEHVRNRLQTLSEVTTARYGLAILSGCLIFLPYAEPRLFVTGWIAFVPLLLAIRNRGLGESWLLGLVAGAVAWLGATSWMAEFLTIFKAYEAPRNYLTASLYWLYAGNSFALVALALCWLQRHSRLPLVVLFPLVFVAVFNLYPMLFHSRLGEAQSHFLIALQAVELTGVYGLDFFLAMTSALLFVALVGPSGAHEKAWNITGVALLGLWFGYGLYHVQAWDNKIAGWEARQVGIVQPNDRVSLDIPNPAPGYSRAYPPEMAATEALAAQGAELVVWPESRYKGYFAQRNVRANYEALVADMGISLLFHDLEWERDAQGRRKSYNTVVHLGPDGHLEGTYRKIKRVPFGEYTPVVSEIPFIRRWAENYFGDFLREITPGTDHATFDAAGMRVVSRICYETAYPRFVAEGIGADAAGKILVFHSLDAGSAKPTSRLCTFTLPYFGRWKTAYRWFMRSTTDPLPLCYPTVALAISRQRLSTIPLLSRSLTLPTLAAAFSAGFRTYFCTRSTLSFSHSLHTPCGGESRAETASNERQRVGFSRHPMKVSAS
ncbi:hypothetical protein CAL65_07420 [Alkalilimnicola ehrlichii]|uniref:CN hydrolase domain-containing protein n=1 Tax=Alkalilimnicola ehrlichii TaxID=351052 RepID=A0A3E0X1G9_9GAMM|nr:hypothetical protein CAL65_07420 [Alkalilimnicola ehrlichii]